ncbi:hypothetical protein BV898_19557 [Hypsibius exemplaris]|uniref:Uncharacterized protein n=1 Tax=Hypsibius exemplaris TaxID=2072580 RepID=A0A9X6NJ58_HYPEX|nr:hypothetical protein BV898_19557 [Hypsibius exemplaris]
MTAEYPQSRAPTRDRSYRPDEPSVLHTWLNLALNRNQRHEAVSRDLSGALPRSFYANKPDDDRPWCDTQRVWTSYEASHPRSTRSGSNVSSYDLTDALGEDSIRSLGGKDATRCPPYRSKQTCDTWTLIPKPEDR